jgi:hypothetical protein
LKKKKKKVNTKKKDLFKKDANSAVQESNMLFEDDIFGLDNIAP